MSPEAETLLREVSIVGVMVTSCLFIRLVVLIYQERQREIAIEQQRKEREEYVSYEPTARSKNDTLRPDETFASRK